VPQNLKYFIILLVIIFLNVSQISFSYYKMEIKYLIINITKKNSEITYLLSLYLHLVFDFLKYSKEYAQKY